MRWFFPLVLPLGLAACKTAEDVALDCAHEESARNLVPTDTVPDWQASLEYTAADLGLEREVDPGTEADVAPVLRERIEAWDCLDLSWWNPAGPRKVVQIWVDETDCALFERASVEYYPCDSHAGQDDPHRDVDQDGFYESEGDCNDLDESAFPEASELCDDVDNNCDGHIDEDLVCDEGQLIE